MYVDFSQADPNTAALIGNHRWLLKIENTGNTPKNSFVFQFTVNGNPFSLTANQPVRGLYILGSSNFTSAVAEITARKTLYGNPKKVVRELSAY